MDKVVSSPKFGDTVGTPKHQLLLDHSSLHMFLGKITALVFKNFKNFILIFETLK